MLDYIYSNVDNSYIEWILDSREMKAADEYTIRHFGVQGNILMEQAAMAMLDVVKDMLCDNVLIVAGVGNNGGDAIALGRLLVEYGSTVTFCVPMLEVEKSSDSYSNQFLEQLSIINNYGYKVISDIDIALSSDYDIIIDGIFGIGINRVIEGEYFNVINSINEITKSNSLNDRRNTIVISIDIPSGICGDNGKVMGVAIKADITVALAFLKLGHLMYEGRGYCGTTIIKSIGITSQSFSDSHPKHYTFARDIGAMNLLQSRPSDGHKGSFGKILIIAGSDRMCGAAILTAKASYVTGAGMVKVITSQENRAIIQQTIPEVMLTTNNSIFDKDIINTNELEALNEWTNVIVFGPGVGINDNSIRLLKYIIYNTKQPLVIDADGISILAIEKELLNGLIELQSNIDTRRTLILTPHVGEYNRLIESLFIIHDELYAIDLDYVSKILYATIVYKDATTLVHSLGLPTYINYVGNNGMATAGSGDVLTGIIASLLGQNEDSHTAASVGVFVHGKAGDYSAKDLGVRSMLASDIINNINKVLIEKRSTNGKYHRS